MILEVTKSPYNPIRVFFGIKNNGRAFYNNSKTNNEDYFYSMNGANDINKLEKFESTNFVIKESDNSEEKEYLISIGKGISYVEIYDFENNKIYQKKVKEEFSGKNIYSFRHSFFLLNLDSSDYYYLLGFIGSEYTSPNNYKFFIQIHKFSSVSNFSSENTKNKDIPIQDIYPHLDGSGVSCFQTVNKFILCFFLNNNLYFYIIAFDKNLNSLKKINIYQYNNDYGNIFYKCIFLKNEIGVFSYYYYYSSVKYYPIFEFKLYNEKTKNIENYSIPKIILNKYENYNSYLPINELIRLNSNKICFTCPSKDKQILIIIIINIYEEKYYKTRYYLIPIYTEYNFQITNYMEIHNYNNLIALAFSYDQNKVLGVKNVSVDFLIFTYPNSTDTNFYLDKYLYNYTSNNNISINLTNEVRIENNLFGYIFSGIEIYDLFNCDNLYFYSSFNNHTIIKNYSLEKNEIIKLDIVVNETSNYNNFTCILKYKYKITEPELSQYDKYPNYTSNNFKNYKEILEKEVYIGRLTYYNIILKENLTVNCNIRNCALCFMKNKSYCIICKYNYTYFKDGAKNCFYEEIITETPTSIFTSLNTSIITSLSTSFITSLNTSLDNSLDTSIITSLDTLLDTSLNTLIDTSLITTSIDTLIKDSIYISLDTLINTSLDNISFISDKNVLEINDEIIRIGDIEIIRKFLKEKKEELTEIIDKIDIEKNYQMIGNDYIMTIKPSDLNIPNTSFIDFTSCEKILKEHYHISEIKLLQLEIANKDNNSLINNIGYQAYDNKKNILDLSLCKDSNIKKFHLIKSNSSLDISIISSFKDLNYDLLNINDRFFKDICTSYAYKKNDVVLKDRVSDFYQNYSVCDEECSYLETDLELMVITCECKVKENLTTNISSQELINKDDIKKSSIFEIIKCYKLFFSWKDKMYNLGFIIYSILLILHIPLIFFYFYKGIFSIKKYLSNEMIKYGYFKKKNVLTQLNNNIDLKYKNRNNLEKRKRKRKQSNTIIKNKSKSSKKLKINSSPKHIKKTKKIKIQNENIINKNDSSSGNIINMENNKIFLQINNKINENKNNNNEIIKSTEINKKTRINIKKEKTDNKIISKKISKINKASKISLMPTQGNLDNKKIKNKNISKVKNENNENNENNLINLQLINININNRKKYSQGNGSNHILNVYTFDEAIKNDMRSICRIYYIYLLSKQSIFYAFLFRSPLEFFSLRLLLLIFIFGNDLALNALFYFDDKISEKYRYTKSLFLFAFSNNITVILLSTLISFIFWVVFSKLNNPTNNIRKIFRDEEEKMKNDKKYIVSDKRKGETQKEIENILKSYKIRTIIFIIIELILMLFFYYYVTIFCHVYSSTQISWIWNSFLSILSRIIIDLLLTLLFAKLYRIGVESNVKIIYKISLLFYCLDFNNY